MGLCLTKVALCFEYFEDVYLPQCSGIEEIVLKSQVDFFGRSFDLTSLIVQVPLSKLLLDHFPNLLHLDLSGCQMSTIDLSALSQLRDFNCSGNSNLKEIKSDYLSTLEHFDASGCPKLERVFVGLGMELKSLKISGTGITKLDLTPCSSLQIFEAAHCGALTSLTLGHHKQLKMIDLNSSPIGSIDCSECPALQYLDVSNCDLTNIDLQGNTRLQVLKICQNDLERPPLGFKYLNLKEFHHDDFTELSVLEDFLINGRYPTDKKIRWLVDFKEYSLEVYEKCPWLKKDIKISSNGLRFCEIYEMLWLRMDKKSFQKLTFQHEGEALVNKLI